MLGNLRSSCSYPINCLLDHYLTILQFTIFKSLHVVLLSASRMKTISLHDNEIVILLLFPTLLTIASLSSKVDLLLIQLERSSFLVPPGHVPYP